MPDPTYKKINNPAPQDLSLQENPYPDPIRIAAAQTLTTPAYGVNPNDIDVNISESGKLQSITISPGRADETERRFSSRERFPDFIAPEEPEDPADRDEATFDLAGYRDPTALFGSRLLKLNASKDAKAQDTGSFMEDLSKIAIDTQPNELNQFASYTYNLALYMINSKAYVDITSQPRTPQEVLDPRSGVSKLLMRSGGTGLDSDPNFNNDFFIDDLEVTNIAAGPNKFKQNTNAVDIRFTITEPRGVTLLERLQDAAATVLVSTKERYIHAPYLLEITFKGYDEKGQPLPAPSTPKYIPIRITDMQFEVTATGTQYKVEAIPFAHFAMGSIVSIIPFNIELSAVTVGDIFKNTSIITDEEKDTVIREAVQPFDDRAGTRERIVKIDADPIPTKNLGEVLTEYQKRRTKNTVILKEKFNESTKTKRVVGESVPAAAEGYDTYDFVIAKDIANAKLNLNQLYDALNTPAPTEKTTKADGSKDKSDRQQFNAYVQSLGQGVTLSKNLQTFKINSGTDISKLLNLLILHSDYMDQNIVDNPQQGYTVGDPINWFKIRPVIKSVAGDGKGFDQKDGRYKYFIDFAVEKSTIHYSDFPWAKKSKPTGLGVHKVYDYIFQGTNTEVLNLDLKFRTAFMQVMTAGTGSLFANKSNNSTFAPLVKEIVQSAEGNTINGPDSLKRARAKDLFSTVMSDGVDMVDLNLQIVGDPAYLPTSDAFWQDKVRAGQSYTTAFMPDGTINYNVSPPYVQVNLKTPTDYDESTGLANPNTFGNSSFSGVYQVSSVESTFSGGVFQQRVYGFRTPLQPTETGIARDTTETYATGNSRPGFIGPIQEDAGENTTRDAGVQNPSITKNVARVITPQDIADEFAGGNRIGGEFDTTRDPRVAQQARETYAGGNVLGEFDVTTQENWDEFGGNTLI